MRTYTTPYSQPDYELTSRNSQLMDYLNCSSQLVNYQSCSSQLENCCIRISQTLDWMSIILQIWGNFYVISLQVLTEKKQKTKRVYQDSRPLHPTPPSTKPWKVTANLNVRRSNK